MMACACGGVIENAGIWVPAAVAAGGLILGAARSLWRRWRWR